MRQDNKSKTLIDIIMTHSKMTDSGCMVWRGRTNSNGYGSILWMGRTQLVHRLIYEEYRDYSLRPGQVVRHMCDNPRCVNPGHLVVGSQSDNMADKLINKVLTPEGGFVIV